MNHYNILKRDRHEHGGGFMLAIHETIPYTIINTSQNVEIMCEDIIVFKHKIRLILAYNPDAKNIIYIKTLLK